MVKMIKIGFLVTLLCSLATSVFAKTMSFKDGGVALWIFLTIGGIIVLLQIIPAAILFFTFIGTTTGLIVKKRRLLGKEEILVEKVPLPGYKPATAERSN